MTKIVIDDARVLRLLNNRCASVVPSVDPSIDVRLGNEQAQTPVRGISSEVESFNCTGNRHTSDVDAHTGSFSIVFRLRPGGDAQTSAHAIASANSAVRFAFEAEQLGGGTGETDHRVQVTDVATEVQTMEGTQSGMVRVSGTVIRLANTDARLDATNP